MNKLFAGVGLGAFIAARVGLFGTQKLLLVDTADKRREGGRGRRGRERDFLCVDKINLLLFTKVSYWHDYLYGPPCFKTCDIFIRPVKVYHNNKEIKMFGKSD